MVGCRVSTRSVLIGRSETRQSIALGDYEPDDSPFDTRPLS